MSIQHFLGTREVPVEVITYKINKKCANITCEGIMIPTGIVHLTYPKDYEHKCSICNFKESYSKTYPRLEYVEV